MIAHFTGGTTITTKYLTIASIAWLLARQEKTADAFSANQEAEKPPTFDPMIDLTAHLFPIPQQGCGKALATLWRLE